MLEVKVTSYGLLAAGVILSLFFGSLLLIDSPLPEFQLGYALRAPGHAHALGYRHFLCSWRSKPMIQPVTGEDGMLAEPGAGSNLHSASDHGTSDPW